MFFYSKEIIQNKKYTIGEKVPDNFYLIKFKNQSKILKFEFEKEHEMFEFSDINIEELE